MTTRGCFAASEHVSGLYNSSFCGQGYYNYTDSYRQLYKAKLIQCCDDKDGCNSRNTSPIIACKFHGIDNLIFFLFYISSVSDDALKCSTCKSTSSKSITLHTLCPNSFCACSIFVSICKKTV